MSRNPGTENVIRIDDNTDNEVEGNSETTEDQAVNDMHVDKGVLDKDQTNATWPRRRIWRDAGR